MALKDEKVVPVKAGTPPLSADEAGMLAKETPGWVLKAESLEREFVFADFSGAMDFVNRVAETASAEDHHPEICISYNRVRLSLSTHKIGGLSRNDFIVAAKINELPKEG